MSILPVRNSSTAQALAKLGASLKAAKERTIRAEETAIVKSGCCFSNRIIPLRDSFISADVYRMQMVHLRREFSLMQERATVQIASLVERQKQALALANRIGEERVSLLKGQMEAMKLSLAQREEALQAEKNIALLAERQSGEAKIAAAREETAVARQECQALREELKNFKKLFDERELYTRDTDRMQEYCNEVHDAFSNFFKGFSFCLYCKQWVEAFKSLIHERRERPIHFQQDITLQSADTEKLQQFAHTVIQLPNQDPAFQPRLGPKMAIVQQKLLAFIDERRRRIAHA